MRGKRWTKEENKSLKRAYADFPDDAVKFLERLRNLNFTRPLASAYSQLMKEKPKSLKPEFTKSLYRLSHTAEQKNGHAAPDLTKRRIQYILDGNDLGLFDVQETVNQIHKVLK